MQRARPVGVDLQVISEKPTPERERTLRREERLTERLARPEHLPLHEVDIEVAVAVVVQQPDAGWDHFGEVELA